MLASYMFTIGACSNIQNTDLQTKNKVFVSILPQKYFVEKIAGDLFDVEVMVKPGFSPETYEPTAKQMISLSEAKIYFTIGVEFENSLLDRIKKTNPNLLVINTRDGIELLDINRYQTYSNPEENDDHKGKDPHIWLSPMLVKIQAENIKKGLNYIDLDNSKIYDENYKKFSEELDTLHIEIENTFKDLKARDFLVFHPAWGYFADEFSLNQYAIEIEGKEPTIKELSKIINIAKEKNIKVIFTQEQISKQNAESIADQIGATIVSIDPLAENYIENLRQVVDIIKNSLND